MEGMVSKEMRNIQHTHASVLGMRHNTERWGVELATLLLEVTHGQWLSPYPSESFDGIVKNKLPGMLFFLIHQKFFCNIRMCFVHRGATIHR